MNVPGDILEAVVTNLPAIDLLSAACVSPEWLQAVRSSLRSRPRVFPWLLLLRCLPLHFPSASAHGYSLQAFDPYSRTWLSVPPCAHWPITPAFLRGSSKDLLCALSPSQLLLFPDPFGASSPTEVKGPTVWRQDPIVAELGRWVVVAGGGFMAEFDDEEEEGAVEVYDKQTGMWELAQSMPPEFEGMTYATWLSVAVSDKRLYVIERMTGWVSQFDPESKTWGQTCQLRPDQNISKWAIGITGKEKLLLVGAGSEGEVMKVTFWEVEGDTLKVVGKRSEEMPMELVDLLYPNFADLHNAKRQACSVDVQGTEHGGYVFDPANLTNGMVMYELSAEGGRVGRWEWVPYPGTVRWGFMERVSVGSSVVPLHQVARCFQ